MTLHYYYSFILNQYGSSVLLEDSLCLDKNYVKKKCQMDGVHKDTVQSFFRPPLSAKTQSRNLKRQREEKIEVRSSFLSFNIAIVKLVAI